MAGHTAAARRKKPKKFIKKAIKRPGALTAKGKAAGLVKGKETLSRSDILTLRASAKKRGDTRTVRQSNLALTLAKLPRARGPRKKKRS